MKKQLNLILPIAIVVLAALALAGWRTWGSHELAAKWPELDGGVYAEAVTKDGLSYLVPSDEIYASGLSEEDRPALTDPKMIDIATADTKLADELEGIAVDVGNQHRFYPFQILNWHEIVHDEVADRNLLVTYSPLTGSAVVYDTTALNSEGEPYHMQDAGQVYNNGLLMADTHGTLWNQTSGQAIVGETVGQYLTIYPSSVMSWAVWKELHPDGLAMSTDTGFKRDYGRHPYAKYETSKGIYFPLNHVMSKLPPKDLVYSLGPTNDEARQTLAFLGRYMPAQSDANEELGQMKVVAFYDEDRDTVRVFNRQLDNQTEVQTLTFEQKGNVITDKETNSRWSADGVAISGPSKGERLYELPVTRHYAFAYFAMFPNSAISGEELLPTEEAKPEGVDLEIK